MSAPGKVRRSLRLSPYKVNYGFGKKTAGGSSENEIVDIDPPEEDECPRESRALSDVRSTGPAVVKKVLQPIRLAPGYIAKNAGKLVLGMGKGGSKKKQAMLSGTAATYIGEPESTVAEARTQPVAPVVTDEVAPVVTDEVAPAVTETPTRRSPRVNPKRNFTGSDGGREAGMVSKSGVRAVESGCEMQVAATDAGTRRSGRLTPTKPRSTAVVEEVRGSQSKKRASRNSGASGSGSHARKRVRSRHGSNAQFENENVKEAPENVEESPENVVNPASSRKSIRINSRRGEQTPLSTQRSSGSNQLAVNESPVLKKKVGRGVTRGLSVRRNLKAGQKISVNIPLDKCKPVGDGREEFTYEVGFACRHHQCAEISSWKDMEPKDKKPIFDHLKEIFDLDFSKPHVINAINTMCTRAYGHWRYKLHLYFKQFRSVAEARRHPSPLVKREDWEIMCNYFSSEECKAKSRRGTENRRKVKILHSGGSKSFVQRLHEMEAPSLIENFKTTHCKSGTDIWLTTEALEKYNQMKDMKDNDVDQVLTEEDIIQAVIGKRRGFVAGHGSGQVPKTSKIYGIEMAELIARAERAEQRAQAARKRARAAKKRAEAAEKKTKEMDSRLCNVEQLLLQRIEIDEPSHEDSDYDPDSEEAEEEEEAQMASEAESVSGSEPELETEDEPEFEVGSGSEFQSEFDGESSDEE